MGGAGQRGALLPVGLWQRRGISARTFKRLTVKIYSDNLLSILSFCVFHRGAEISSPLKEDRRQAISAASWR